MVRNAYLIPQVLLLLCKNRFWRDEINPPVRTLGSCTLLPYLKVSRPAFRFEKFTVAVHDSRLPHLLTMPLRRDVPYILFVRIEAVHLFRCLCQ